MEHVVWLQCFVAEQSFYLSFPPYGLSLSFPPSSLVSSPYPLPRHLMPKGNSAAGTATAASYLILPEGANWCWQHALQAEVLSCFFFKMVQSITQFSFPHSQEESQMPLEICLILVAVAAAALKISAISKYSLRCNGMKKWIIKQTP